MGVVGLKVVLNSLFSEGGTCKLTFFKSLVSGKVVKVTLELIIAEGGHAE